MKWKPHAYQRLAVNFLENRLVRERQKGAGLFMAPGLGKTGTTLDFITRMRRLAPIRTLVLAPLRVVTLVWPLQIQEWEFPLSYEILRGSNRTRALRSDVDLHITNFESLPWLAKQDFEYDLLVVDESTRVKNWSAVRTKLLRNMLPRFRKRIILTGEPIPNAYSDLFSQIYLLDDGAALGKTKTFFESQYCVGHGNPGWYKTRVTERAEKIIEQRIAPMTLRMGAEEFLDMPELVVNNILVELPPPAAKVYRKVENELFAMLESGETLVAGSSAALYGLCRQIANGGAYESDGKNPVCVHEAKVDALEDLHAELYGRPLLVFYQFNHDVEHISKRFPGVRVIRGGMKEAEILQIVNDWNEKKIPLLAVQCQALSHGVNMQKGGVDVCWYGLPDQLELYNQANARIWRQGVEGRQVRIHRILCVNTVEEAVRERLEQKDYRQRTLLDALSGYRKRTHERLLTAE